MEIMFDKSLHSFDERVSVAIVTDEQLREGKRQLTRHKKTTERAYRRGELRSFLQKMTGTGVASPEVPAGGGFLASLFAPSKKSKLL